MVKKKSTTPTPLYARFFFGGGERKKLNKLESMYEDLRFGLVGEALAYLLVEVDPLVDGPPRLPHVGGQGLSLQPHQELHASHH